MTTIAPAEMKITASRQGMERLHRATCKRVPAHALTVDGAVLMGGSWQVIAATAASCCKPSAEQIEAAHSYARTGMEPIDDGADLVFEEAGTLTEKPAAESETAEEPTQAPEPAPAAEKPEETRSVAPQTRLMAKHYRRWFVRQHGPAIALHAAPGVTATAKGDAVVLSGSKVDVVTAENALQTFWNEGIREFEAWRGQKVGAYATARKADRDAGGVPWGKSTRRDVEIAWIADYTEDRLEGDDLI